MACTLGAFVHSIPIAFTTWVSFLLLLFGTTYILILRKTFIGIIQKRHHFCFRQLVISMTNICKFDLLTFRELLDFLNVSVRCVGWQGCCFLLLMCGSISLFHQQQPFLRGQHEIRQESAGGPVPALVNSWCLLVDIPHFFRSSVNFQNPSYSGF